MSRGEVLEYATPMPMQIKLQREGNKVVAMLPAYNLPCGLIVEANSMDDAIEALRVKKVRQYWRGRPEE